MKKIKDTINLNEDKKNELIKTIENLKTNKDKRDKQILFRVNENYKIMINLYCKAQNIKQTDFLNLLIKNFFESDKKLTNKKDF